MIDYQMLFDQTKKLSILLVEDYAPLRNEMAEVLENFFKMVVVSEDGEEALALYQEYDTAYKKGFDIVLTDIQMPRMDGVELSERIRQIHGKQTIIVLSAHTDSAYLLKLINLGISKFITKPIQDQDLLETLYKEAIKLNTTERIVPKAPLLDLGEGYIWDKEKELLRHGVDTINLTKHEILLVKLFLKREEQVCTTEDILHYFQDHQIEISEKNIRNLVFKVRKKIPEKCIQSIYGLGYKFTI